MNTSENKNLVLALVLMLAVWFAFTVLFPPAKKVLDVTEGTTSTKTVESVAAETTAPSTVNPSFEVLTPASTPPVAFDLPVTSNDLPSREIVIETEKYQAVFTTSGARLISYKLKEYRETAEIDAPPVQMYAPGALQYATLRTSGVEGYSFAGDALFETSAEATVDISDEGHYLLQFRRITSSGVELIKSYDLSGNQYTIATSLVLRNASQSALRGAVSFALVQRWNDELKPDSYTFAGPASMVNDKIDEVDVDDLEEKAVIYGSNLEWTSFQTKYFLSLVVPGAETAERIEVVRKGDIIENIIETPYFTLPPGASRQLDYFVFIGPKDMSQLKAAGHQLEKVLHFGFFDILAKPLFFVLTFFYGFIHNYGFSIILLTVLIKLIFWPLTHKSYSSMKSMQKLQPEMKSLREKYSKDKERLNKELMGLYKVHKVNPLGGCLPMLVQIPVFFALYKVLLDSIALRHAPFALWLTDLSAKDPYYITPLLMGASMFVQQKMTPTTADPMQAKIFMMMPIVFTFLFLNFPSGLVIYWLVNNLLTIAQQYYIHRQAT